MTFADEVTADAPYVWWDTRQASGHTQPDKSGHGHTGTITGSPVASGSGLTFDNTATGADQYITSNARVVASGTTYTTWAFEVVCQTSAWTPVGAAVLSIDDWPNEAGLTEVFNHSGGNVRVSFPAGALNSASNMPTGSLVSLIVESNATNNLNIYLNGTLDATGSGGAAVYAQDEFLIMAGDGLTAFGGGPDGWNGLIRHGMFYNHSLGATRAAAHYSALSNDPSGGTHFTPPTELTVSNIAYDAPAIANALRKYYPVGPRGRAVWRIPGDATLAASYTFNQPYPWVDGQDVANGNLFPTNVPRYQLGSSDSNLDTQTIVRTFYGGSTYPISADESTGLTAFLTANGYTPGDWIT